MPGAPSGDRYLAGRGRLPEAGSSTSSTRMTPTALSQGTNEAALVRAAREFLQGWSAEALERIPPACRPGAIRDGDDLVYLAVSLKQERVLRADAGLPIPPELNQMYEFFRRASRRYCQLYPGGRKRGDSWW